MVIYGYVWVYMGMYGLFCHQFQGFHSYLRDFFPKGYTLDGGDQSVVLNVNHIFYSFYIFCLSLIHNDFLASGMFLFCD